MRTTELGERRAGVAPTSIGSALPQSIAAPRRFEQRAAWPRGPPMSTSVLEREADAWAEAVRRGDRVALPELHRAVRSTAAPFHEGGRPLPEPIAARVRERFAIDTSEVRVHRGSAVDRVLAERHAVGLAFATDIFVARAASEHVLLHELAHVIQQTATPTTGEQARCIAGPGHGAAQPFDAKPPPIEDVLSAHDTRGSSDPTVVKALADVRAAIAAPTVTGKPAPLVAAIGKVKTDAWGKGASDHFIALAVDLLKQSERYDEAVAFVAAKPTITTTFWVQGMIEAAGKHKWSGLPTVPKRLASWGWIDVLWRKHPKLDGARPVNFLNSLLLMLLNERFTTKLSLGEVVLPVPAGSPAGTKPTTKLFDVFSKEELGKTSGNELQSELFIQTLMAVQSLDTARMGEIDRANEAAKLESNPELRRYRIAAHIESWATPFADVIGMETADKLDDLDDEQSKTHASLANLPGWAGVLLQIYLPKVQQAARATRVAWDGAFATFYDGLELPAELQTDIAALRKAFASAKGLAGFRTELISIVDSMMVNVGPNKDQIPELVAYSRANAGALQRLEALDKDVLQRPQSNEATKIAKAILAGKNWRSAVDQNLVIGRFAAHLLVHYIKGEVAKYKYSEDVERTADQVKRVQSAVLADPDYASAKPADQKAWVARLTYAVDYRAAHRIHLAALIRNNAQRIEWSELETAVQKVIEPDQGIDPAKASYQQRSLYFVATGDWEFTEPPLSEMVHDETIGAYRMIGAAQPIRPRDVYVFLQTLQWAATNQLLATLLKPGGTYVDASGATRTDFEPEQSIPAVLEAHRKQRKPPRRWTLKNYIYLGVKTDFGTYLLDHPKTDRMAGEERGAGRPELITTIEPSDPAVIWTLPSYSDLITAVRKDPTIDKWLRQYHQTEAIAEAKKKKEKLEALDDPPALPTMTNAEWSSLFIKALNKQIDEARAKQKKDSKDKQDATSATADAEPKTELGDAAKAFYDGLQKKYDTTYATLIDRTRQACIRTRQYYTAIWLEPWIDFSNEHWTKRITVKGQKELLAGSIPSKLFTELISIGTRLAPGKDQSGHVVAMVLALAPKLKDRWKNRKEYDLITQWKPVVEHALAVAAAPDKPIHGEDTPLDTVQSAGERSRRDADIKALKEVDEAWAKQMQKMMTGYGFVGGKAEGKSRGAVRPSDGGNAVQAGKGEDSFFMIDGIRYSLVEVYQDFEYHPSYRPGIGLGERKGAEVTRPAPADASTLSVGADDQRQEIEPYKDAREKIQLFRYQRNGVAETVTGDREDRLAEFTHALAINSVVVDLNALAGALEAMAGIIMDGIELIPGVGQAVAAARIATAVFMIMAGTDFDALMTVITTNPLDLLKKGVDKLKDFLDVDHLWKHLLFGRMKLVKPAEEQPNTGGISSTNQGSVRKIFSRIARLGRRLVSLFSRFQRTTVAGVDRLRLAVLKRPFLARLIRGVAHFIHLLSGVRLNDIFNMSVDDVLDKIRGGVKGVGARIRGFFLRVSELVLPREIIPLDAILSVVVDFVVNRLGGKYKYAAKGFLTILDRMGKKQDIYKAITSRFVGSALDPNNLIETHILPLLAGPVQKATNGVYGVLTGTIAPFIDGLVGGDAPFKTGLGEAPKVGVTMGAGEDVETEDEDPSGGVATESDDAQLEAARDPTRMPRGPPPALPAATSGAPLGDALRDDIEGRIGQDLAHVRLHRDGNAQQLTDAIGAHAVTSGSHVFMRPGLDIESSGGARVLRHEIGHVLQQTGPRPLDVNNDTVPRLGAAGLGVTFDPVREATADAIADMRGPSSTLVPTRSVSAGLQPSPLDTVVGPLLTELSGGDTLVSRAREDDRGSAHDDDRALSPDQQTATASIWRGVRGTWGSRKSDTKNLEFALTFADAAVQDALRKHLGNRETKIANGVDHAAAQALVLLKPTEVGNDSVPLIEPTRFRDELIGAIFGESGVVLDLQFNLGEGNVPGAKKEKQPFIDAQNPVKSIKVVNLDLREVVGGGDLWKLAFATTLKTHVQTDPLWLESGTEAGSAALRARCRGVLGFFGIGGVFESKVFSFSDGFIAAIKKAIEDDKNKSDALKADQLPVKGEYLDHAKVDPSRTTNIGLRIGRFNQTDVRANPATSPSGEKITLQGQQRGVERESHHTTQFLLLEFFENGKDGPRAFPVLHANGVSSNKFNNKELYPGITASGAEVDKFVGSTVFPIADFAKGRGGLMPAILVARVTHRSGGLHVSTSSVDFGGGKQHDSQGGVVRGRYQTALGNSIAGKALLDAEAKVGTGTTPAATGTPPLADFQAAIDKAGRADVKLAIEKAMRETYRWMYYDVMEPALLPALIKEEMPYYNELASVTGKEAITENEMKLIAEQAKTNNIKVMKESGFQQ
ncbi:MAG TPA: DUF4157 domain-containing protein [Nannocystaceae bacterium]|nr:DUF4157 domain-containing protein [Nannocystaceae bacterium]